jgi:hypothetical protein
VGTTQVGITRTVKASTSPAAGNRIVPATLRNAKVRRAGVVVIAISVSHATACDRREEAAGSRVAIALRTYLAVVAGDRPVLAAIRDVIAGINSADVAVVAFVV